MNISKYIKVFLQGVDEITFVQISFKIIKAK